MFQSSKRLAAFRVLASRGFITRYLGISATNHSTHGVPDDTSLHKNKGGLRRNEKTLPASADVVVIGGGSIGCSTAYHLAKLNAGKVILLEKERLTSGTTWHTAGLLFNRRDSPTGTQLHLQTRDLISKILPEETGFDAGWIETGGLFITRNKIQLNGFEKKSLLGTEYGIETWMVDPAEISRLHPLMNTKGIIGGIYSPHDGTLDPTTLCTSYVKAAAKYKAEIFEKCEVKNIKTETGVLGLRKIVAIETNQGTIKTNNIVNCTGAWAPYIAKMVGVELPQVTYKHSYVVTQGIPGIENTPQVRDVDNVVYHKRQGDALLFGGYEKDPEFVGMAPEKDFSFGLYDMDWEKFEQFVQAAIDLVPSVGKVGIRSTVCGPESFTPDYKPLIGETPELRGFFNATAFNSGGLQMGGGAGRQIAHWIVNGSPEYDMHECDINRFSRKFDRAWLMESCQNNFAIRSVSVDHPFSQKLGGRNLRTTPLTEQHISNGAYMNSIHEWEVPMYFMEGQKFPLLKYDHFGAYGKKVHGNYAYRDHLETDASFEKNEKIRAQVARESNACYEAVGVVDLTHLSKFSISGSQADHVVQALFSSDVSDLADNTSTDTLLLGENGKIVAHVTVTKLNGREYKITAASELQEIILRHVNQYLLNNDIKDCLFQDITDNYALLKLVGPQSVDVLKSLVSSFENDLQPTQVTKSKIGNAKAMITRCDSHNVPMYEIRCTMNQVDGVHNSLMTMSSETTPARIGLRAFNSVLLETGLRNPASRCLAGALPNEANLMNLCPLDGDREYVGKPALVKMANMPLKALLIQLTASSEVPIYPQDVIWRNGKYAGLVKDATYGCKTEKYQITGFVKAPSSKSTAEEIVSGDFSVGGWARRAVGHVRTTKS